MFIVQHLISDLHYVIPPPKGEMGFFRIELGRNLLGIEDNFAWATPAQWTAPPHECHNTYVDPSVDTMSVLSR